MTKNLTYAIFGIIAFAVLSGGIYVFKQNKSAPVGPGTVSPGPVITPSPSPTAASAEVHYTGTGFVPSSLNEKPGATVMFVNDSDNSMWVASNPHPVHTAYPEFEAKRAYVKGESYSFTFTRSGTWGYHNHMRPSDGGTITVE